MKQIITLVAFFCYATHLLSQVVITELMADPSPTVGLPEQEYVEIFNQSNVAIVCSDLQLIVGEKAYQLPAKILEPQEFICITSQKAKTEFADTSHMAFLKTFPSIANSGQTIALEYNTHIISSVTFTEEWYSSPFKAEGGWALEKRDTQNLSETRDNWGAAQNHLGGTPGYANSVATTHPDTLQPHITSLHITNDTSIVVSFSENIASNEFTTPLNLSDDNQIYSITELNNSLSHYVLFTSQPLQSNKTYTLTIPETWSDIAGNSFAESSYTFAKTDSLLQRNAIIFTEILFNPAVNEPDFIELYNNSNAYFDLSQVYLSNNETFYAIADEFCLFSPHSYALISPDAELYKQRSNLNNGLFITTTLPTMPNDAGTIMVLNRWEEVIDSLTYSATWQADYLTDPEGVSLERIDFNAPTEEASSWVSAATIQTPTTPDIHNSLVQQDSLSRTFSLASEVITPNADGENDELVLYSADSQKGAQCSVRIYSPNGRLVALVAENLQLGTQAAISWDCTTLKGTLAPNGIYIIHIETLKEGKTTYKEKKSCTILHE